MSDTDETPDPSWREGLTEKERESCYGDCTSWPWTLYEALGEARLERDEALVKLEASRRLFSERVADAFTHGLLVEDVPARIADLTAERDEARAEADRLRKALEAVVSESRQPTSDPLGQRGRMAKVAREALRG